MAIPKIQELYNPILGYLLENTQDTLDAIRKEMKEFFYMTPEEAFEKDDDNKKYTLFEGRVNTACLNLYYAGLLLHPKKGVYAIADKGKEIAGNVEDVDRDYLWNFKKYREYARRRKQKNNLPVEGVQDQDGDTIGSYRAKEYEDIQEVTIKTIIELKKQDARFANMMAAGIFMLEGGQIREVPYEVLQADMSMDEYRETTSSHGELDVAFTCKIDAGGSGKMKAKRHRDAVSEGTGPRPRKWENPEPFVSKTINEAINKVNKYRNAGSFTEAMKILIKDEYKISYAELSRRTGISEDKLRNMCTSRDYNPKLLDLMAIFLILNVKSLVCKLIFSLAGISISEKKYEKYLELIELDIQFTPADINAYCDSEGIDTIFEEYLTQTSDKNS